MSIEHAEEFVRRLQEDDSLRQMRAEGKGTLDIAFAAGYHVTDDADHCIWCLQKDRAPGAHSFILGRRDGGNIIDHARRRELC